MSENSTHVEGLEFHASDVNASAVADKIGAAFQRLHHTAEIAKEKVGEFAHHAAMGALASVGLGLGLHSIFEKATEANMEMARITRNVAGAQFAFQGWKPGISAVDRMTYSMRQGAEVAHELHEQGLKLRQPIEAMSAIYSGTAALGFSKLGMNQKEVLDLTEKMAAAAKVYGISGEEAVSKVTRALIRGKVSERDVSGFAIQMREWLGQGDGPVKKGQKLKPEEIMKRIENGMKGMVPAAQALGQGMAGSMFEAKMMVDEMLRDLSGPLFKEQSASLAEWVQKLRAVKEDGKSILETYGEKIAGAFRAIKDTTVFIVSHWKILLGMFAASKLANTFAGMAAKGGAAAGHGVAGALGAVGAMNVTASVVNVNGAAVGAAVGAAMQPATASLGGKLAGLASKTFMAAEALGGLYVAAEGLATWIDSKQTESLSKGRNAAALLTATHSFERSIKSLQSGRGAEGRETATASMRNAFSAMGMKQGQKFTAEGVGGMLAALPKETALALVNQMSYLMPQMVHKTTEGGLATAPTEIGREIAAAMNEYSQALFAGEKEFDPNKRKVPKGAGDIHIGNLTITQDFKEADPDRVFHKVTNEIAGLASSPGTSKFHIRGGI